MFYFLIVSPCFVPLLSHVSVPIESTSLSIFKCTLQVLGYFVVCVYTYSISRTVETQFGRRPVFQAIDLTLLMFLILSVSHCVLKENNIYVFLLVK